MRIREINIVGYRSLRAIRFPVGALTVFVGANGVGKTNLYRALQLLQAAAAGTLARELASEGGMESALWAGKRMANKPARMKLSAGLGADQRAAPQSEFNYGGDAGVAYSYEVDVGLPMPTAAAFPLEPQIKEETLVFRNGRRPLTLLERRGPRATAVDEDGHKHAIGAELLASETALGALQDPARFPDVDVVRRTMLDWKFYHDFRSDRASPLRQPCLAVTTPTLGVRRRRSWPPCSRRSCISARTRSTSYRAVDDAFPGARLIVPAPGKTAAFGLLLPDYPKRVFEMAELSDGTLRYLALAGALLGYRLPAFIALNEPETSLHPELLEPLARMIIRAAERTQIWVVTHSERLAKAFADGGAVAPRTVIKRDGETWIEGLQLGGDFECGRRRVTTT